MNKTLLTLSLLLGLAAVGKASETAVYIYDGKQYSAKERQALLVLVHQGNLSSRTVDTGTMYTNSDGIDLVCLNSSEGIFLVPTTITPDNDLSISLTSSTQSWTNLKYPNLSGVTKIHLRFRVAVNAQNFPDENFRNYILAQSYGSDAVLTKEEIADVKRIIVSNESISDLKGIEYFTAMTTLQCYDNKLTSLDVSKNTALISLDCTGNKLTSLDLSKNTKLTTLYCNDNRLTSLDLSNNTKLTYIVCSNNQLASLDVSKNTLLTQLYCNSNQLTSLDLSNNTALVRLSCNNNRLTSLDVSNNTALTNLGCGHNRLTSLDVSKNTALTELSCYSNQLASLDVSKNTLLTQLSCYSNQLASLDVSGCTALTKLYCYSNQIQGAGMVTLVNSLPKVTGEFRVYINSTDGNRITTVQVAAAKGKGWSVLTSTGSEYPGVDPGTAINATNFPDANFRAYVSSNTIDQDGDGYLSTEEIAGVTIIDVNNKSISDLKGIEYFTAMTTLQCYDNQLISLDVSKNTKLTYLYCYDNQLISLDVSKNTALKTLHCRQNQLTSLDLSKNTALTNLQCHYNRLTSLDLSKNTALTFMTCYSNQLTSLDLSKNTKLTMLECSSNQLTSLNVSGCTALTELWCYSNQLASLDVSKNTVLTNLICYANQLTSLDLSKNTALTKLECYYNQLTSLDVSKNTALTNLDCAGNQLTSLDVSNNTALEQLWCYNNQIQGAGMATLIENLPTVTSGNGNFYVYSTDGTDGNRITTVQVQAAVAKGWSVKQYNGSWVDYPGLNIEGDANGDGEVNVLDIETVRDYILGRNPQPFSLKSADLNYDEVVDIADLTLLIDMMK